MKLPMLPHDKANHFVYGALITAAVEPMAGPEIALATGAAFAAGKEIYDLKSGKGEPSVPDAVATLVGSLAVVGYTIFGSII